MDHGCEDTSVHVFADVEVVRSSLVVVVVVIYTHVVGARRYEYIYIYMREHTGRLVLLGKLARGGRGGATSRKVSPYSTEHTETYREGEERGQGSSTALATFDLLDYISKRPAAKRLLFCFARTLHKRATT